MTNKKNGFTLIELLVVVLIIGILAAIALPQYQKAVEKSRAVEAVQWARKLADAEEIYYLANGSYTMDYDALGVERQDLTYFWGHNTGNTNYIDPSTYNIHLKRKSGDYDFRYFMQNVDSPLKGRFMCIAKLDNKIGTQVCRALSNDKTGFVYPHNTSSGQAYYLN